MSGRWTMPTVLLIALGLTLGAIAGCGDSGSSTASSDLPVESGAEARKRTPPVVEVPPTRPPKEVVVEDLIEGSGDEAREGDMVLVNYVGLTWNGEPYADSWEYPEIPGFVLGSGELAPGFDEGIRGMKVGGRRQVLVPTDRLRTAESAGIDRQPLRPRDALVLVVDLLEVN